jgi:hypothetical protein
MRNLKRNIAHFIPDLVEIIGHGTGAATSALTALDAPGVVSVDQTGTGLYTVLMEDKWASLKHFSFEVLDAGTPDDWDVRVVTEDVAGAKTITLAVFKGGTLTDLTTDEKLYFRILVSNSSRPR